jgi:hypothetical protein
MLSLRNTRTIQHPREKIPMSPATGLAERGLQGRAPAGASAEPANASSSADYPLRHPLVSQPWHGPPVRFDTRSRRPSSSASASLNVAMNPEVTIARRTSRSTNSSPTPGVTVARRGVPHVRHHIVTAERVEANGRGRGGGAQPSDGAREGRAPARG